MSAPICGQVPGPSSSCGRQDTSPGFSALLPLVFSGGYADASPHAVAASSSSVVAGEHTASTRVAYWHGGAPGLTVGDLVLPASVTGTAVTLAAYMDEGERLRAGYRRDRVYVTTLQEAAEIYAALYPNGGWVYRVLPQGQLEADPDCDEPGLSFACLGARVVDAYSLDPLTVTLILQAVLAGGAR